MPMTQGRKGRSSPSAQAAEDAEEDFLGHVLGVVAVVQEADAQAEDIGLVEVDRAAGRRLRRPAGNGEPGWRLRPDTIGHPNPVR